MSGCCWCSHLLVALLDEVGPVGGHDVLDVVVGAVPGNIAILCVRDIVEGCDEE